MFLKEDVFSIIFNIANKDNIDIVEFKCIETSFDGNNIFNNKIGDTNFAKHKLNTIMRQPELSNYPIRAGKQLGKYHLYDVYLWGKCIKTKIYQKAVNKLGEERYSRWMTAHEDVIMTFVLFNTINTFKFVGKYGIVHIKRKGNAFSQVKEIEKSKKEIYLADVVIDFAKNTEPHKKLVP